MNIYESAVRKPISTALIFIGVVIFGLFSLQRLAVDQYPEIELPMVSVITTYVGANASDVETNVTRILEDALNTVDGLVDITSTSSDNVSVVTLEFEYGSDLTNATNDIRDAVSLVQSSLPDDVDYPTIFQFSSSMMPIMMLAVTADESYAALEKILDDKMVNTLNRIDGVGSVSTSGAAEREVQVNVDPKKIAAYGLTVEQIGSIIAAENINISAGTIDIGNYTYNIKSDGEFNSSDDLNSIVISNQGGRTIMLKDIAQIKDTLATNTMDERLNGELGVRVIIQKQSGANTVDIVKEIYKQLPKIEAELPDDVKVNLIFEGSEEITDSIKSLSSTIMYAFIFVILVVMFFLGRWRATFIICLTIPISLVCSFIYLFATGSTINIISLSSLSIAIGMVVDDAIVVLENISSHIDRGSSPKEASIYATNEVWLSVIATTLVTVAVFLPLTMIPGMAGIMFRELGWIVSIVVTISTVAAITLTPMLSSLLLTSGGNVHDYKGIGIVYKPIDKFLVWLDETYSKMLLFVLRYRRFTLLIAGLSFVGSLMMMANGLIATEYFPPSDNGRISAMVKVDQNLSVEYTSRIARQIDSIIYAELPEVSVISASAGANSSSNAFAALQTTGSHIINYNMRVPASVRERDRTIYEMADVLRDKIEAIPEVYSFSVTPGGGAGVSGATTVDIDIFGHDMDVTNAIALDVQKEMRKISIVRDVELSRDDMRPEYNVNFDREKLAYHGIGYSTAAMYVTNRIYGYTSSIYREDGDEYDIVVRYAEEFRESLDDVEQIMLYSSTGRGVRLRDVATIEEVFAAPSIERENRERIITVSASPAAGVPLGDAAIEVSKIIDNYELPDGITMSIGGTVEDQQEAFADLGLLLILIVILVYIVMATQFESLLFPFIIMFTIPLAFTGVILALFITNVPLSLIALIGSIMLVGIVTKNGIVMVDYINLLVERGATLHDAIVAGAKSRLRPVLMTSFTTILGMTPMALGVGEGSETWQPMGIAVIGGLSFSTMLTLLVVPIFYALMVGSKMRRDERKAAKKIAKQNI